MDQINKTASKVRTVHDKKPSMFGAAPVMAEKPILKPSTPAAKDVASSIPSSSIKGSSVGESERSLVVSNKGDDNNSDSDSVISKNRTKRAEQVAVEKFELEKCTTIRFISLAGEITEKLLTKRVVTYSELQREIARLNPKVNKMYVIQNNLGVRITSDYFRHDGDTALIRVKEIGIPPDPAILKTLNVQWEIEGYHEVRAVQSMLSPDDDKQDDFSDMMSVSSYQAGLNEGEEDEEED